LITTACFPRPTQSVQNELQRFYGANIRFNLDFNLSNYQQYGYGDITYFTVT